MPTDATELDASDRGPRIVPLARGPAVRAELDALRGALARANPGYALAWEPGAEHVAASELARVLFVQSGPSAGRVSGAGPARDASRAGRAPESPLGVGDAVLLRAGETLALDRPTALIVLELPGALPPELPTWLRPDWDPLLTDAPGGCAEDERAYRRILLTWLETNGPYVCRDVNVHRVRMTDSFSHYHPLDGGFDELYLVQSVAPEARLYLCTELERVLAPETVTPEEARSLVREHVLAPGDLVYLPRGTVHRAAGGVLAQVITIPGFRPGAEIGVDHHLRAIHERLGPVGGAALPYRVASSHGAIVR